MEVKLEIEPIASWGVDATRPLYICGPCSAETEEQVMETARAVKARGVQIYRAGIWKPRTRPNSFEGIGGIGLQWLRRVKEETGLLTATEVANAKHVIEALKAGIDILWVGARTTVNPFAVQEVADALQGVDIPVLVKNPINPDLELWIGGLERIAGAGITKLGAIHRGFSLAQKGKYRNSPEWQLAVDLRRKMPNLPIIGDPSHIAGLTALVPEVAQQAMDIGLDGLMIETHPNPKIALSDGKQQLTPDQLSDLMKNLIIRQATTSDPAVQHSLEALRHRIDEIDHKLIGVISDRMDIVRKIGQHKKDNNMQVSQPSRYGELLRDAIEFGSKNNLSEEFITRFFEAMHQESINIQEQILNSK